VPRRFSNTIDYVTISSTGNAQDFGDLSQQEKAFMEVLVLHQLVELFGGGPVSPATLV
jgi:hypothetical protein